MHSAFSSIATREKGPCQSGRPTGATKTSLPISKAVNDVNDISLWSHLREAPSFCRSSDAWNRGSGERTHRGPGTLRQQSATARRESSHSSTSPAGPVKDWKDWKTNNWSDLPYAPGVSLSSPTKLYHQHTHHVQQCRVFGGRVSESSF